MLLQPEIRTLDSNKDNGNFCMIYSLIFVVPPTYLSSDENKWSKVVIGHFGTCAYRERQIVDRAKF
ncbi:protein of unknown function [Vibrio tapetis subsp. tapetis]|uniref:Uncharacterized protein n=1 Tax=Vibrio tapetis subsp. tapetis TaxID=1671868 RepID=A0A2N8ZAI7_9VIBR|nr:protein of unknown function [Vibrio tapetis subsp. tapetis]